MKINITETEGGLLMAEDPSVGLQVSARTMEGLQQVVVSAMAVMTNDAIDEAIARYNFNSYPEKETQ